MLEQERMYFQYMQMQRRRRAALLHASNIGYSLTLIDAGGSKKNIHVVDYKQLKELILKQKLSVYDQNTNAIYSLGKNAYNGLMFTLNKTGEQVKFEYLDLSYCWYIGDMAMFGCDNLKVISFANKKDTDIPILEDVNALFNSKGEPNTNIQIVVPDSMYNNWCNSVNWAVYKNQIKKVSEYGN